MTGLPSTPFEPDREMGTVIEVRPGAIIANLPHAAGVVRRSYGHRVPAGEIGEYVLIDSGDIGIFARVSQLRLPESNRLAVEVNQGESRQAHPIGVLRPLSTIYLATQEHAIGLSRYPRLGDRIFSAHPSFLEWMVSTETSVGDASEPRLLLGELATDPPISVSLSAERLFGRHCAVLGSTGAGKSWTLSRLVGEASASGAKAILVDATGEYHTMSSPTTVHVSLGIQKDGPDSAIEATLPYYSMHEMDLFGLLKPSPNAQAPRLREAIRSLRLAASLGPEHPIVSGGCILKQEQPRKAIDDAMRDNASVVGDPLAYFEIDHLAEQVQHECVWPSSNRVAGAFGGTNQNDLGYCTSLLLRIDAAIASVELGPIFHPKGTRTLMSLVDRFLSRDDKKVLRISLKHVPFAQDAREVMVNAIGRHLLSLARAGSFSERPLLIFVDEAHNFLDRTAGDEYSSYPLDSFELIAKEGRKYGLLVCLATQRARDLPEGVISQLGTFLVHRLSNDRDRELIERGGSDLDRDVLTSLPSLTPGEIIGIGVGFPIPLTIRVAPPHDEPDSRGPRFSSRWKDASG